MKIEFLGTGGAMSTPRPGCHCRICVEARAKGVPYSRTGPMFVHGPNVLFDTPEEAKEQINRSRIKSIEAAFYSHWHPDHVLGRRVWESLNADWRNLPPQTRTTKIYLPERVAADFRRTLGTGEHFSFMDQAGFVSLHELADGEEVTIRGVRIQPFRLAVDYVYAFLLDDGASRILIAMDELYGWSPPSWLPAIDVVVLPIGVVDVNPLTGERTLPVEHPVLQEEATFNQTLSIIRGLKAKRVYLTHIEEPDGLSFDDLQEIEQDLRREGLPVTFAYDTLLVDA